MNWAELGLMAFVWLVMLLTPVLFRENNDKPLSHSILKQLEILVPLSLIFAINRWLLVPKFLFKHRPGSYLGSILLTIFLITVMSYLFNPITEGAGRGNRPPAPPRDRFDNDPGPPARPAGQAGPAGRGEKPRPVPPFANLLIFSILVVGFDTGLRSALRWIASEKEKTELEKENVASRLLLLRSQISPHFFMNTLNNIHALIDSSTEEAKEAIIKLSKMMRYQLYETDSEMTSLKKEAEFLSSYIDLMRLRFSEKVKVSFSLPDPVPEGKVPPFMLVSFIENAFKHGISYDRESYVNIDMVAGSGKLILTVRNSRAERERIEETKGIGLDNTRKRLDLIYGNSYRLDIIDNPGSFTVNLSLPL